MAGEKQRRGTGADRDEPPRAAESPQPFPSGHARPQADGDPDGDSEFAGNRSAPAEDVAQADAPDNDGWSGVEDNVENRPPGDAAPARSDPHHRGDRRFVECRRRTSGCRELPDNATRAESPHAEPGGAGSDGFRSAPASPLHVFRETDTFGGEE